MDSLRIYDYLALARQRIFDAVRPLSAEQYAREFPIGLGTLARTLTHIMVNEWYYVQRMMEREVPPYNTWPISEKNPPAFGVLETEWKRQADETRAAIREVGDWNAAIEYCAMGDGIEPPVIVTCSATDIFTELALHEVHHRAQALNMLRHLGTVVGDIDFNAMMFQRRNP
jgi:uncharacterized damage-inducible protein DinB